MVPHVLIVQSRPEVASAVSDLLADVGFEAVVVAGGHTVLAAVEARAPQVVLVDLALPALDGWCVLAAVGSLAERPLLVVRVADGRDVGRAIVLGADVCIDDFEVVAEAGRLVPSIAA